MSPKIAVDYETQIEEIIKWFEWEKVHKTMLALEWKWAGSKVTDSGIPSIGEIIVNSLYLLNEAAKGEEYVATGGLVARNIDKNLSLEFVVTSWEHCIE